MLGDGAATARPRPESGQVLAGKYRIERELGHGGMGVVYAATHRVTGRRVAIKMLSTTDNAAASERFLREAQAAGRIDHPNVVQVLDVGDDAFGPFIVMELLSGEPLSALLSRMRLKPSDAIDLLIPALRGVHAAHQEGVVHRDLKPENIFLCRDREGRPLEAKVLDFGISKLTFDSAPVNTLTRPGSLIGTPHYMAPERVRGHFDSDPRTDVYSFGVILYEVLTGTLPFNSHHFGELIVRITTEAPRPPRAIDPEIPAALQSVVLKAMARRIEDRYADVESLGLALEPFASEQRFQVQRRDPTGQHLLDHDSIAPTMVHESGEKGSGTLDPIITLTPAGVRGGKRLLLVAAAAALLLGAAGLALWPHGPSPHVMAAAAPAIPPPSRAFPEARPLPPAPAAAPTQPEPEAASKRGAHAPSPRTARARATRRGASRTRVAQGVRTRGMSEQEF